MGNPKDVNFLFPDTENLATSSLQGVNKYNYSFFDKHNAIQFIGLDSGEDTGKWDTLPEASGLSLWHQIKLDIFYSDITIPKIIFMHSPVYNDELSFEEDNITGERVPDGSITRNWRNFIDYCANSNVQLMLSGHTHKSAVYNLDGSKIDEPETKNTVLATTTRPLFIQTQSATKDEGDYKHGY